MIGSFISEKRKGNSKTSISDGTRMILAAMSALGNIDAAHKGKDDNV